MEVIHILVVLLLLMLFVFGLVSVVGAFSGCDSSPRQIARRSRTEIEQIASEGEQAMDDLSEQYLSEVYEQATHQRRR